MNFQAVLKSALALTRKHTPLILTATAVAGVVSTAVLAAKAAPEAQKTIVEEVNDRWAQADSDLAPSDYDNLSILEKAQVTWRVWIPTVASGALTITSIILIHTTHQKRYAALMGLYVVGERAFQEYRESVDEVADKKTVAKVKEKVSQKAESRAGEAFQNQLVENPDSTIIYDGFSGRSFIADLESVRAAVNDFNQNLIHHSYGTLNELYSLLGWEGIAAGEDVGWNSDELLSVSFNPWLTAQNKPAIHFSFDNRPFYNYYNNH